MKIKILFLFLTLFLASCGGYRTTIKEQDYKGYLKFTGNLKNVTVVLDDKTEFPLEAKIEQYEVKPGQYEIKIFRDQNLIVNRIIIVESQTTYQIEVP